MDTAAARTEIEAAQSALDRALSHLEEDPPPGPAFVLWLDREPWQTNTRTSYTEGDPLYGQLGVDTLAAVDRVRFQILNLGTGLVVHDRTEHVDPYSLNGDDGSTNTQHPVVGLSAETYQVKWEVFDSADQRIGHGFQQIEVESAPTSGLTWSPAAPVMTRPWSTYDELSPGGTVHMVTGTSSWAVACDTAKPGDILALGTIRNNVLFSGANNKPALVGTADKPIFITNDPDATGPGALQIWLQNCRHVHIVDHRVRDAQLRTTGAIQLMDCRDIVIRRLEIDGYLHGQANVDTHGVSCHGRNENVLIEDYICRDIGADALQAQGVAGLTVRRAAWTMPRRWDGGWASFGENGFDVKDAEGVEMEDIVIDGFWGHQSIDNIGNDPGHPQRGHNESGHEGMVFHKGGVQGGTFRRIMMRNNNRGLHIAAATRIGGKSLDWHGDWSWSKDLTFEDIHVHADPPPSWAHQADHAYRITPGDTGLLTYVGAPASCPENITVINCTWSGQYTNPVFVQSKHGFTPDVTGDFVEIPDPWAS